MHFPHLFPFSNPRPFLRLHRLLAPVFALFALFALAPLSFGADAAAPQTAAAAAPPSAPAPAFVLDGDTPWVVAANQPEAVSRALADVATDWHNTFGIRPVILRKLPDHYTGPAIYFGLGGDWRSELAAADLAKKPGAESFILLARRDAKGRPALVATGADTRGTIYAAYAFSEDFLGVDPWHHWVEKAPVRRDNVAVPAGFAKHFGPPSFKYRGWFINDEDLLNTFAPDPLRENVFSLEMFDKIYETLLRLRGNMVVPATFPFPDERCQKLASRRGLALNMHHILVLGLNTYRWPKNVPFSYSKHPAIMERYWQDCIDVFKNYGEVVWTVGYRGQHDRPFWADEPHLKTPSERGALITKAIAKQVEMVRKVQPNAAIIANLWMEGADLQRSGHLKIPDGVTVVWPDNGQGILRDNGSVKKGEGIYYHTAMLNGRANQLSELVNPGRIYDQVGRFARAGATEFFLVNVSDIRPVPLSTDCAMKFAWDTAPYIDKSNEENMAAFFRDWSRRQFGDALAAPIAALYHDYFHIAHIKAQLGDNDIFSKIANLRRRSASALVNGKPLSDATLNEVNRILQFCGKSRPDLEKLFVAAEALAPRVPAGRRDFYQSHLLTQIALHKEGLAVLEHYARALLAYQSGDKPAALAAAGKSQQAARAILSALQKAEVGKWAGWYRGARLYLADPFLCYDTTRALIAALKGEPAPPGRYASPDTYKTHIETYQEPFKKNFPLLYPKTKK
ncbi:MAG: glycosyl hydrolase 115 family protein [Puniceicoccales bacterium]|jgi:hypothetical protein|nr:glycosyl hydrolase 115 family protein [Puniceicoccales bacterium]